MKKTLVAILTALLPCSLQALPVGNPWDASLLSDGIFCHNGYSDGCTPCNMWGLRVGFYGDYVFNRHLEVRRNNNTFHSSKIFTNAGYLALNLCNRLDLFSTLGTSQLQFETRTRVIGLHVLNEPVFYETETHFSWSLGARGTVWECGSLGIGAEAQYFQTNPRFNFIRAEGFAPTYLRNHNLNYKEWQLGLGASYRVNIGCCSTALVPYTAIKWSHARAFAHGVPVGPLSFSGPVSLPNLQEERHWGCAVGITLVGCNKMSMAVEGRFGDERALYVNMQFRL